MRLAATLLAVSLAAGVGCGGGSTPAASRIKTGTSQTKSDPAGEMVRASDQTGDGKAVLVETAVLKVPGYVAVQADNAEQPGAILGVSPVLPAGTARNVYIRLAVPLASGTNVWAVVRIEGNGDRTFDDAHDPVAGSGTSTVAVPIRVLVRAP
jgi:hypothetical protein